MNPGASLFSRRRRHATVNGLTGVLLSNNPNFNNPANNANAINPFPSRPQPGFHMRPGSQLRHEQQAFDEGLMDSVSVHGGNR